MRDASTRVGGATFPSRTLPPSAFQEEEHEGPRSSLEEEKEEEVKGGRSFDPLSVLREIHLVGGENRLAADSLRRDALTGGAKAPTPNLLLHYFISRPRETKPVLSSSVRQTVLVSRDRYRARATRGK